MKIVHTLVFTLIFIFDSIESSSLSGQPGKSIDPVSSILIGKIKIPIQAGIPAKSSASGEIITVGRFNVPVGSTIRSKPSISGQPSILGKPPKHQLSSPEEVIPFSLQKPLEWMDFSFPKNRPLQYYGKHVFSTSYRKRGLNSFIPVPTNVLFEVQVNEFGEVFGFRKKKIYPSPTVNRLYLVPYQQVAISIYGDNPVRRLTEKEIEFLNLNPSG